MKTYLNERLSVLTPALTLVPPAVPSRAPVVERSAVSGACAWRSQQESVQSIRTRVAGSRQVQLVLGLTTDHGTNGFVAPTSGMAPAARKGGKASGIPPRDRQV
jgi:hypothetical protein